MDGNNEKRDRDFREQRQEEGAKELLRAIGQADDELLAEELEQELDRETREDEPERSRIQTQSGQKKGGRKFWRIAGITAAACACLVFVFTALNLNGELMPGGLGNQNEIRTDSYYNRTENSQGAYSGNYAEQEDQDVLEDEEATGPARSSGQKKEIRNIRFEIEDRNISGRIDRILTWTEEAGGYVSAANTNEDYGSVTVKIPEDQRDGFVKKVRKNSKVTSYSDGSRDVTSAYTDAKSRLETKRAAYKRYEKLMDQANSLKDVMDVQEKMDQITEDIESYEAQLKAMDEGIQYTTVSFQIVPPGVSNIRVTDGLGEVILYDLQAFLHACIHVLFILPLILFFIWIFFLMKDWRSNRRRKNSNDR